MKVQLKLSDILNKPGVVTRAPTTAQDDGWSPFIDFATTRPPALNPQTMIPDSLSWFRDWGQDLAAQIGVAPDFPFTTAIGALSLCVSGAVVLEVKPGYPEIPPLWWMVVAAPSERKSPVHSAVIAPITKWESDYSKRMAEPLAQFRAVRTAMLKKLECLKDAYAKSKVKDGAAGIRREIYELAAECERWPELNVGALLVSDTTSEGLARALFDNGGVVGIVDDEGASISTMAGGRYSDDGPRVEIVNKGYSGTALRVQRAGKSIHVESPLVVQILAIQPAVVRDVIEAAGAVGRGYLARILFVTPESRLGKDTWTKKAPSEALNARWASELNRLLDLPHAGRIVRPAEERGTSMTPKLQAIDPAYLIRSRRSPKVIRLSQGADRLAKEFYERLEGRMDASSGDLNDTYGWAGKIRGNIFRIALSLHMLSDGGDEVQADVMRAAIAWFDYLHGHFLASTGAAGQPEGVRMALHLLSRLRQHGENPFSGRRALQLLTSKAVASMAEAQRIIDVLVEWGYIREIPADGRSRPGRRSSTTYEVRPELRATAVSPKPRLVLRRTQKSAGYGAGTRPG